MSANKECISGTDERINMLAKCIVHMHITAELKAYWLSCLFLCWFSHYSSQNPWLVMLPLKMCTISLAIILVSVCS